MLSFSMDQEVDGWRCTQVDAKDLRLGQRFNDPARAKAEQFRLKCVYVLKLPSQIPRPNPMVYICGNT